MHPQKIVPLPANVTLAQLLGLGWSLWNTDAGGIILVPDPVQKLLVPSRRSVPIDADGIRLSYRQLSAAARPTFSRIWEAAQNNEEGVWVRSQEGKHWVCMGAWTFTVHGIVPHTEDESLLRKWMTGETGRVPCFSSLSLKVLGEQFQEMAEAVEQGLI